MDKGNEKRGIVQLVCVLLAFCLWLYVTSMENPNKSSEIKDIPVDIINSEVLRESNLALSPNQNFTVNLRIDGPANAVYSAKVADFKVTADLGTYVLKKGENNVPVRVVNYPQDVNVMNTGVLSIKINVEEYTEKYVNVVSKVDTLFKEGFVERNVEFTPQSVKIYGPESAVSKVKSVALIGETKDISEDFESEYELIPIDSEGAVVKGVSLDKSKGTLKMQVGKGTEVPIKVKYMGSLKNGLSIEKETLSKNKVSIIGDPKAVENIKYIETEPLNLSDIVSSKDVNLKLSIPEGITVSLDEQYVTVSLKIKDEIPVTKSFSVKVDYIGVDANHEYTPNTVNVVLEGTKEALASIKADNIKVEASVGGLVEGNHEVEWKATLVGIDRQDISIKTNSGKVSVVITTLQ
ncbi:MAG: hypothetical protein KIC66_08260 [Clostridium sp.]|uniref:YbbR-like protein n=1 Tax=Clostridium paraputrificum TaxID=29363 RepID=A0A6N3GHB1_9CLOT|nr:CdaR family protein [Clostridium sp.]MBS5927066.1 hypothetical protein [Clostridium sp.]MBS5987855.1 hypothetical protein [Clostridium sp.]